MKKRIFSVILLACVILSIVFMLTACQDTAGEKGDKGDDGQSAYQVAVSKGYTGSELEWLASLVGETGANGKSAYELAVEKGYSGTEEEWLTSLIGKTGANGLDGAEGKSAYELAVINGFDGNLSSWLASLVGPKGDDGAQGVGVAEAVIENGTLIVRLTNGKVINCGKVVGADGVGITSVTFNETGELIVTLTDGSVMNCGRPPVCNHTYSEWQLGRAATCTSIGYSVRTCSKCQNTEYDFTEEAEHTYSGWLDMISTCTEHWQVRICSVCGTAQIKSAEPVGHRFEGASSLCVSCGKAYANTTDLSCLDIYNGTYGYEYLGTTKNGEAKQALYKAIDKEVRIFHVNSDLDAEGLTVASLNFTQLGLTADEAVSVWKTFKDDNPLYYWLSNTVTCTDESMILLTESEYADGTARERYNALIYNRIKEYSSRMSASDTFYRIALAYHDFICDAIDYAYTDDGKPETAAWAHNILGVFNGTGAVCEGYARSFQILLNYSGVENLFVTGTAGGESHAWNLIRLDDGNWYWCDLTWDDSFVGGLGGGDWKWGIAYDYFCVNDNTNTVWSEGGWEYDNEKTFLDTHTFDTGTGVGANFLYNLPARSTKNFSDETQVLLNTKFSVSNCDFTVVGYDTVELNYITGAGHVEIPETVTYNGITYTVISLGGGGNTIFSPGITSVHVPKTVKFIWDFAFRQTDLDSIVVDEDNPWFCSQDGVLFTKSLYTLISYPSANMRTEYAIPVATREVAYWSFDRCKHLEKLTIGANVSVVGIANWGNGYHNAAPTGGFGGNVVEGGIYRIGAALAGNKAIIVDKNNKSYASDDVAIYNYDKSKIYYILNKDITVYHIPANLALIDSVTDMTTVFYDCTKLERFTIEEGNPWFSVYDGVLYNKTMTEIIAVPRSIKGDITIPEGVTKISRTYEGSGAGFFNCENLTGITLPETLTIIGSDAFSGCTSLVKINIPKNVTTIGNNAFMGCTSLVKINIPNNVTTIGDSAFNGCRSLTDITIPDSMTSIKWGTFTGCRSLTDITIPDSVTSIGAYAFKDCNGLTDITIPDSVTSIGGYAFCDCTGLKSVIIPDSVTSIGNGTFYNCHSLTSVTIGSGVTSIGEYAFYDCRSLTDITIPDSVTSIGGYAFAGYSGLTSVTFKNPEGWKCTYASETYEIPSSSLSNASEAAILLKDTYYSANWERN